MAASDVTIEEILDIVKQYAPKASLRDLGRPALLLVPVMPEYFNIQARGDEAVEAIKALPIVQDAEWVVRLRYRVYYHGDQVALPGFVVTLRPYNETQKANGAA